MCNDLRNSLPQLKFVSKCHFIKLAGDLCTVRMFAPDICQISFHNYIGQDVGFLSFKNLPVYWRRSCPSGRIDVFSSLEVCYLKSLYV
jgi:hypothetical protein